MNKNLQIRFFVDKIEQIPCKGKNPPPIIHIEKVYVDLNNELQGRVSSDLNLIKKIDIKNSKLSRNTNMRKTNLYQDKKHPANICHIM